MDTINDAAGKPKNLPRNMAQHFDAAGTSPNRYSKQAGKKFKKELNSNNKVNIISKAMSNKKVIIGVAAGVAALAVTAIILKRKGYLDGIGEKAEELASNLKDKYRSAKESAGKKIDELIHKGEEIADNVKAKADSAATS